MLKREFRLATDDIPLDAGVPRHLNPPTIFPPPSEAERSSARHPALTIAIHWGTVAAIVAAVAVMFIHDAI